MHFGTLMDRMYKYIHIPVSFSMAFIMLMNHDVSPIPHCLTVNTVSFRDVYHSDRVLHFSDLYHSDRVLHFSDVYHSDRVLRFSDLYHSDRVLHFSDI
jgi:hypothetical protein